MRANKLSYCSQGCCPTLPKSKRASERERETEGERDGVRKGGRVNEGEREKSEKRGALTFCPLTQLTHTQNTHKTHTLAQLKQLNTQAKYTYT